MKKFKCHCDPKTVGIQEYQQTACINIPEYVVLRRKRRHVVSYDSKNKVLSVPVSCRPPLLIDRALTLCTGLIPAIEEGKLKYGSVPKEIAYNALELLRQKLI